MNRLFLILSLSFSLNAFADNHQGIEELFDALQMEKTYNDILNQTLDLQIQQNPTMLSYRDTLKTFFDKYISYEQVKPDLEALYSQTFSESEIKELTAFYKTPTGQKAITAMPQLFQQGAMIGQMRVQENMGELEAMLTEEINRRQAQETVSETE